MDLELEEITLVRGEHDHLLEGRTERDRQNQGERARGDSRRHRDREGHKPRHGQGPKHHPRRN